MERHQTTPSRAKVSTTFSLRHEEPTRQPNLFELHPARFIGAIMEPRDFSVFTTTNRIIRSSDTAAPVSLQHKEDYAGRQVSQHQGSSSTAATFRPRHCHAYHARSVPQSKSRQSPAPLLPSEAKSTNLAIRAPRPPQLYQQNT